MRRIIHYCQGNNYKVYEGIMHPLSQIYWHQLQVFTSLLKFGANCIHRKWILLRACAEEICQGGSISENHRLSNLNNCGKFHACIRNSTILALSRSAIRTFTVLYCYYMVRWIMLRGQALLMFGCIDHIEQVLFPYKCYKLIFVHNLTVFYPFQRKFLRWLNVH